MSWTFGGALAGQPPAIAWTTLGVAALAGVVFVWWSYERALIEITPVRRAVLVTLRGLVGLGLLLILAAPTRIHRFHAQPPGARPLAVLVDRSDSMTTPDNRQQRRLDDALRRWRALAPAARTAHSEIKTFVFADDLHSAALDESPAGIGPDQTKFFAALQRVLDESPAGGWAGVVTLTDGLDTTGVSRGDGVDATARAALGRSTALFFVSGRNRFAGGPFFRLRDFTAPATATPHSTFRVEATFENFQPSARTMDVQCKVNGVARPDVALHLEAGHRLTSWSTEIQASDPGVMDVDLRVGDEFARASVRVEHPRSNRILYFQGALDWSYRFLADTLRDESSFTITPVFNFPNPDAVLPPGALRHLPDTVRELEAFDIVILANAAAAQFSTAQQAELSTWVRDGGVLLFFTPDDDSTEGLAGSELEKMLPVLFAPPQRRGGLSAGRLLSEIGRGRSDVAPKLVSFAWEKSPRVQEIFAAAEAGQGPLVPPRFSEYAHVAQAKPGADVLARHPSDLAPDGNERAILLAVQRYGRGQSGVLTTDALWRWKLNQPAAEHDAARFWQTLFAWLTREHQSGLRFDDTPHVTDMGREISLRVLGATAETLKLEARNGEKRVALSVGVAEGKAVVFPWRPTVDGLWRITASDGPGREATHWITVKGTTRTGELSGAAPDEGLLLELAARTGGAMLENLPPPIWWETPPEAHAVLLGEHREALWHRTWIFATMLGLYGLEMILRRKWRML